MELSRKDSASFGKGQRLRIAATVLLTAASAVGVWLLLNYVTTRPRLRTTLDLSRSGRFTISDATQAMLAELRERQQVLRVDTYFLSSKDSQLRPVAQIQQRVLQLTGDLLRRLEYYGGDQIEVTRHNVYEAITKGRAEKMGLEEQGLNSLKLRIGRRERKLDLLRDMADIEIPQLGPRQPGRISQPVLRDYKGEEAFASALRGLLREKELVAYWVRTGADPGDPSGAGVSQLGREMVAQGFENRRLDLSTAGGVPDDCSLLLLLGPVQRLSRRESATILAYLRSGGRALMTIPIEVGGLSSEQLSFRNLLGELGVRLSDRWLFNAVSDPADPTSFRFGDRECARIVVRRGMNANHPVTARLRRESGAFVELHRARGLTIERRDGVTGEYLLSTHPKAWEVDVPELDRMPSMARPGEADLATRHVAASLEVDGAPSGAKGRMVVISGMVFRNGGDPFLGRMAGSLFSVPYNQLLAVYLVNWLVREESLVTVPAQRYRARTMTVEAPQLARVRTLLVWVIPAVFLFLSFFVVFWRRRA